MRIILAPDSYKDCLPSLQVCLAMERGIKQVLQDVEIVKNPIADGGAGSVDTFIAATGGRIIKTLVQDPLGRLITGFFGLSGDGSTAVIEMAAASGLQLLAENERNPLKTSTFGTGQLILAALDEGVKKIVMCIGGSSTIDGGLGMAKALGIRFQDSSGLELGEGGQGLNLLAQINPSGLDPRVVQTEFVVACDVINTMVGSEGAAAICGSQKGASSQMIEQLDQGLTNLCKVVREQLNRDIQDLPGAGVAGGLGGGVVAFLNGRLTSGIDLMIEATNLKERLRGATLVFTGEGRLDQQSVMGKISGKVGKIARELGVPAIAMVGSLGENYESIYESGIAGVAPILAAPIDLETALREATRAIISATARTLRIFLAGSRSARI